MSGAASPWRRTRLLLGLWIVLLILLYGVSRSPELREMWCTDGPGANLTRILGFVTGPLPFSLAEVLEWGLGLTIVVWIVARLLDGISGRPVLPAIGLGFRVLLEAGGGVLVLFYGLWGINYARDPLDQRLGWEDHTTSTTISELEQVAILLREAVNADYRLLHTPAGVPGDPPPPPVDDLGAPTGLPPRARIEAALTAAWPRVEAILGLPPGFGRPGPRPKARTIPLVYEHLWLLGMYNPYTAEAQYNGVAPAVQLGVAIAHEGAHQRGIAPEDEANFIGFVCALLTDDPFFRYSARLFAHRQLTREVQRLDEARAREIIRGRLPGVQRDVVDAVRHWDRTAGLIAEAGRSMNDLYLKTNGVEGGVEAYSRSAALILGWWRRDPEQLTR